MRRVVVVAAAVVPVAVAVAARGPLAAGAQLAGSDRARPPGPAMPAVEGPAGPQADAGSAGVGVRPMRNWTIRAPREGVAGSLVRYTNQ